MRWRSLDQQPKGWDPDIDDGVAVNLAPFQKAGILAHNKVLSEKDLSRMKAGTDAVLSLGESE